LINNNYFNMHIIYKSNSKFFKMLKKIIIKKVINIGLKIIRGKIVIINL